MSRYYYIFISTVVLALLAHTSLCAEKTENPINITTSTEFYPTGFAKKKVDTYVRKSDRKKIKIVTTFFNEKGIYLKSETKYFDDPIEISGREYSLQKIKEDAVHYEVDVKVLGKDVDVKIDKKQTQDDEIGGVNPQYAQQDRLANQDFVIDPHNGQHRYKYKSWIEFLDDYHIPTAGLVTDRDFIDHKRTYRYRFNNTFDLKMQNWKPGFEYWLNKEKTKSIDLVYDRTAGGDLNGAWMLRYRKTFF